MSHFEGKQVLVTGGCGSIGSELVRRVLNKNPQAVRVLDTNEEALFQLGHELDQYDETLRLLLGDIRDRDRLEMAIEDIDVVLHAAALKHVELNEYNPFEAVQTNVHGTQNLIRMAIEEEVETFLSISTDKASNPTSVMGATKLLAERLTVAANTYKGKRQTKFGCVRFGNVLGSSGSVVPVFEEQIRDGGPLTVTDPGMTRFIMPIERAVDLVLSAQQRMEGGEVFVLKMPAFDVGTLAEVMCKEYSPRFGHDPGSIETDIVGPRPGERTHEKLISPDEASHTRELEDMFVLLPQIDMGEYATVDYGTPYSRDGEYTSADARHLSTDELTDLINEHYATVDR